MFNFSANHLFLISRTEYASYAVLVMLDHDTRRVYRLFDFTKRLHLSPDRAYCVAARSTPSTHSTWSSNQSSWTPNTSGVPLLLFLLTAREGNQLGTLLLFLTAGTAAPIADDTAGMSADMETGAPRCRFFRRASAVIPDRR
jgi:hypothetical protein